MHFRLPTPLRGWREFAGEVGIIVIGVLIALGAQQLVENRNDRTRANDAMAALRREVADQDFTASEIEIARPCIDAQLDAIERRLTVGDRAPLPFYSDAASSGGYVIRIPDRVWSSTTWDSVSGTDVLRRLEPEYAYHMAAFYAQTISQRQINEEAKTQLNTLNSLAVLMPREEGDRMRYIDAARQLRASVGSLDIAGGQLRDRLAMTNQLMTDLKRQRLLLHQSGTLKFCRTHGLPLAKLRPAIAANAD